MRVILASGSPRRAELIKLITENVIIRPTDADESFDNHSNVYENVMSAAKAKAMAADYDTLAGDVILGVDTIVVLDGVVFGKPKDKEEARLMISSLSGRNHKVISGVCLISEGICHTFYDETTVTFDKMTDEEIESYISTPEPYDKAGAYAVQGLAGKHISSLNGCYYNVVGLPVNKIYNQLRLLQGGK